MSLKIRDRNSFQNLTDNTFCSKTADNCVSL